MQAGAALLGWVVSLVCVCQVAVGPPAVARAGSDQTNGQAANRGAVDRGHVEREQVRLILLPTVATDPKGRPVRDLEATDFLLFEDDEPRPIEFFATEKELPISIAFVLDVSGSMELRGRLDDAKRIIRTFADSLNPGDRAGLICFADQQVTWVTDLTTDRARFLRRLEVQRGHGPTALYDALAASPGLVDDQTRERRAIVLLTDGLDNASNLTQLEAVWLARRVRVPIYTINFIQQKESRLPKGARQNLRLMDRFSSETGGKSRAVHSDEELAKAVSGIQAELTFQYLIGYHPSKGDRNGAFRRIRLDSGRRGVRLRTRSGYYADP